MVEIDQRLRALGRVRRTALAEAARLLLAVKRTRLWRRLGFGSLGDYARDAVDFGERKTRELIELAERCERLPLIAAAFESGEVFWTKLRTVAAVAEGDESAWLEKARELSSRQLELAVAEGGGEAPKIACVLRLTGEQAADVEEVVRRARKDRPAITREEAVLEAMRRGAGGGGEGPAFRKVIYECPKCAHVSIETRSGPEAASAETVARAECDAELILVAERKVARTIPARTRERVMARDRHRCSIPGCSSRDWLDVHHVKRRSEGGTNDDENLATLCGAHHAAAHDGTLAAHVSTRARAVFGALRADPTHPDELIEATGLEPGPLALAMCELTREGLARQCFGGWARAV